VTAPSDAGLTGEVCFAESAEAGRRIEVTLAASTVQPNRRHDHGDAHDRGERVGHGRSCSTGESAITTPQLAAVQPITFDSAATNGASTAACESALFGQHVGLNREDCGTTAPLRGVTFEDVRLERAGTRVPVLSDSL